MLCLRRGRRIADQRFYRDELVLLLFYRWCRIRGDIDGRCSGKAQGEQARVDHDRGTKTHLEVAPIFVARALKGGQPAHWSWFAHQASPELRDWVNPLSTAR